MSGQFSPPLATDWWRRRPFVRCVDCGKQATHIVSHSSGTIDACSNHVNQYAGTRQISIGGLGVVERHNWTMQVPSEFSTPPPDWREETAWDTIKAAARALLAGVRASPATTEGQ